MKTRGRPVSADSRHLSDSLLTAAETCLHEKSHLEITVREIASNAGTHAGMVNYYFNNKSGLLSSLVDSVATSADDQLRQIEADIDAGVTDPTGTIVRCLSEAYREHSPSMTIAFIEMFRPHSEIIDAYSRRGGSQAFIRIERLIRKLIARGDYRHDLDPASTTWMIICLVIGPHLLYPVWRAMGSRTDAPGTDRWIAEVSEALRKHVTAPPIPA